MYMYNTHHLLTPTHCLLPSVSPRSLHLLVAQSIEFRLTTTVLSQLCTKIKLRKFGLKLENSTKDNSLFIVVCIRTKCIRLLGTKHF